MNFAQIFGSRLENLMEEHDINQIDLAENLYVTNSALSTYVCGKRVPRIETIYDICKFFDVSIDYMFGLSNCRRVVNQSVANIPIYKTYIAGQDNSLDSNIEFFLPIAKERFNDANNLFGIYVKTPNMRPRFYEGDLIIVERTKSVESSNIVMVTIGTGEAIIRELTITNGGWVLNPFTPLDPPTFYSWQDMERQNIRLIGKVIESVVKY